MASGSISQVCVQQQGKSVSFITYGPVDANGNCKPCTGKQENVPFGATIDGLVLTVCLLLVRQYGMAATLPMSHSHCCCTVVLPVHCWRTTLWWYRVCQCRECTMQPTPQCMVTHAGMHKSAHMHACVLCRYPRTSALVHPSAFLRMMGSLNAQAQTLHLTIATLQTTSCVHCAVQ